MLGKCGSCSGYRILLQGYRLLARTPPVSGTTTATPFGTPFNALLVPRDRPFAYQKTKRLHDSRGDQPSLAKLGAKRFET